MANDPASLTDDLDPVGPRMVSARLRQGLSRPAVAAAIGIDVEQLDVLESGAQRMDISEVVLAADALGVTTRELLGMPEAPPLTSVACTVDP